MKKADIISEYNSLTATINNELENYKRVSGEDFPGYPGIRKGNMDSSYMLWGKDDLERTLCMRKSTIYSIREKSEVYTQTQEMKSTEEGKAFIQNLTDKKAELEKEIDGVSDWMFGSFNDLLEAIGLKGWSMVPTDVRKTVPSFRWTSFEIYKMDQKDELSISYPHISIYIDHKNGKWEMELNSATSGGESIHTKGDEYWRFKAYVTLCDHDSEIQEWMENIYTDMAHRVYDLEEDLRKVNGDIENPYAAWTRK